MPKITTENAVSEAVNPAITLDDFANRKMAQSRGLTEGIAAFCHVQKGQPHRSFTEWDAAFVKFMNSPAE